VITSVYIWKRGLLLESAKMEGIVMKCPYCNFEDTKVVDSRPVEDGLATRRRRECTKCKKRFTTFEKIENSLLVVVKKDGTRESFDKNKIVNGIMKACQKTKVTYEDVQRIADNIERGLSNTMEKEIQSTNIGLLIMEELKAIDQVAYVRFASVYREFQTIDTFIDEINKLTKGKNK
jgi:transcriptional repressor NrdR